MSMSDYLSRNLLQHVLQGEEYKPPEKLLLAAFTKDGEVSASDYERQEITYETTTNHTAKNDKDIYFPVAKSDWGLIEQYVVFDENDNELDRFNLKTPQDVKENQIFGLPKNEHEINM